MKKLFLLLILPIMSFEQIKNGFEIQGHRGCRGLRPENTVPAFLHALDLGVQTLELDVVISKDHKVVVSHEAYFNPAISTDPNGNLITKETQSNLYQLDYEQIKKYDVGKRGNAGYPEQVKMEVSKPLLSEVLKTCEKYIKDKKLGNIKYNIEIKSEEKEYKIYQPEVSVFCELVYKEIIKYLPANRVILQSFDANVMRYLNFQMQSKKFKKITLSWLIEPFDNQNVEKNIEKLGFKPDIWSPFFAKLNKEIVEDLHQRGIRVIPWTVNLRKDMENIKAMGCDGLITDYPDRAKGL
ncbi:MAG: glycerophosphodiester phosphodiesterase family protein [Spirosomataceae bacterium]